MWRAGLDQKCEAEGCPNFEVPFSRKFLILAVQNVVGFEEVDLGVKVYQQNDDADVEVLKDSDFLKS